MISQTKVVLHMFSRCVNFCFSSTSIMVDLFLRTSGTLCSHLGSCHLFSLFKMKSQFDDVKMKLTMDYLTNYFIMMKTIACWKSWRVDKFGLRQIIRYFCKKWSFKTFKIPAAGSSAAPSVVWPVTVWVSVNVGITGHSESAEQRNPPIPIL